MTRHSASQILGRLYEDACSQGQSGVGTVGTIMETVHNAQSFAEVMSADTTGVSVRRSGLSWLAWVRHQEGQQPDPARTGLDPEQPFHVAGRCLLALATDAEPCSWCRRERQMALFYGYLTNREELQQRLELPPAPPASDAELLLWAYETWGCDAVGELEGAYAAVVWDLARDTFLCARDPTGMMPVAYAETSSGLVMASDQWTLLRHPDVSGEINRLVAAEHMLFRNSRVDETLFQQVRRLPPGHRLVMRGGELQVTRYWDPLPPPGEPLDWMGPEELATFPALMQRTMAGYMAFGPTAISLSAGIDSVSVAAFATEAAATHGWPRPHALSLHFDDPSCDESAGQSAVATSLDMPFRLLSFTECVGERPLLEAMMELSATYPWPIDHIWVPLNTHLVDVARSRGIRVLLTGIGGDEWLGVTPRLAADLIRAGDLAGLWRLYHAHRRSYDLSPTGLAHRLLWHYGLRQILSDSGCRHFPGWMARRRQRLHVPPPDWLAPDPELRRQLCERLQPPPPEPILEPQHIWEIRVSLQHPRATLDLEQYYYRARGRGLYYFHPYWSRPVVEFLIRVPVDLLNTGGRCKGFVRQMLAERFPGLNFETQRKVNAVHFFSRLISEQWPDLWRRWAPNSALARAGMADVAQLGAALQAADPFYDAGKISLWLSTEAWLRARL